MRTALVLVAWLTAPAFFASGQDVKQPYSYGSLPRGAWACLGSPRFVANHFISRVAFSPDGKLLAAVLSEELAPKTTDIHLWDLSNGKELPPLRWHNRMAFALRFTRDGKKLLVGLSDQTIRTWDLIAGKEERRFNGGASALELTSDGKRLIAACSDDTIRVWDFATAKELHRIASKARVISLAPDGRTLATSGAELLWDIQTGKPLRQPARVEGREIQWVCCSSDGKTLAALDHTGEVTLWDLATCKERFRLKGRLCPIDAIAFSHDGKVLATGGRGYRDRGNPDNRADLQMWDVGSGRELSSCEVPSSGVVAIAFSPDDRTVATASDLDLLVRLWDWKNGRELPRFTGHGQDVTALAFSPDGHSLYSASKDRTVRLWDAERCREQALLRGHSAEVTSLVLTPDNKIMITGSRDHTVRLWDVAAHRELRKLTTGFSGDWRMGICMTISPGGRELVISGASDDARLAQFWDWRAGKELRRLLSRGVARCLALTPDGKTLATGSYSEIRFWDTETGKPLRGVVEAHNLYTMGLAFLSDGTLASAGGVNAVVQRGIRPRDLVPRTGIRLWDPATGTRLREFPGAEGYHTTLAVSPDGRLLAASFEAIIRVWEISTWQQVGEFQGHRGYVSALAFSPDGRTLASGGADGAILFWDLTNRRKDGRLAGKAQPPAKLKALWTVLAEDGGRNAVWALTVAPEQAVPFLRRQVPAIPKFDAQRVRRLIADLDAEKFTVREKATGELEIMGEIVVPVLRTALRGNPTLEQDRRLRSLLDKLDRQRKKKQLPPSLVRVLRSIEVLERAGTPEAVEVLRGIAAGEPTARPTQDAQAALKRLANLSK